GEGKTLVASMPAYLNALPGKGVHVTTVNDYLARRDAEWMGPIYQALGLSVGALQMQMPDPERHANYRKDITYGMASEFGFDFLRDRLRIRGGGQQGAVPFWAAWGQDGAQRGALDPKVQREHNYAIVDEADSILVDEARTPLVISTASDDDGRLIACYRWSAEASAHFEPDRHCQRDPETRGVQLTAAGRELARSLAKPPQLDGVGMVDLFEHLERAVRVRHDFQRDREYVVDGGRVAIVEEYTGRIAEGRRWRGGIHQAIEAKEGLPVTLESAHAARVTMQDFLLRYEHLAGMTGTARGASRELSRVYRLHVVTVPTHKPGRRDVLPPRVFRTADEKWSAIVEEIDEAIAAGRPVLAGTRSVGTSERLSARLRESEIEHVVLNALRIAEEAEIVAHAGQPGRVTIATNMAGRGTDILLGDGVAERGGLHVLITEMHDSQRIDRQLAGRCGRQGDPGSVQTFLSLDDDILAAGLGPDEAERLRRNTGRGDLQRFVSVFRLAQRQVERRQARQREDLLRDERRRQERETELGRDVYLDAPA
ncbi:MAG: preprotein translocase subunit SecA, partial [Vicinamibacterales bacterium]